MLLSARETFRQGDAAWQGYVGWICLPSLYEVRTLDASLNPFVPPRRDEYLQEWDAKSLLLLPDIDAQWQYYLLAVNLTDDSLSSVPASSLLMGYDLSDNTHTSSVLNCGAWIGKLEPLSQRLNGYGLLSLDDAVLADSLLPEVWGEDEEHAYTDIWALYDVSLLRVST